MTRDETTLPAHERVMEILGDALELPTADRAAFVDHACAGDADVHREVQRLLTRELEADQVIGNANAHAMLRRAQHASHPRQIGPYRIVRPIGGDESGAVYLAEQREPVRRLVALKVLRGGSVSSDTQAILSLSHPNLAKTFDLSETYIVREFVPGEPIISYCQAKQLSLPARLELFAVVCDAIRAAHEHGVIHGHIKHSNVLIMVQAGEAVPKVVDFGVGGDADRRSDVRAMGALLRELVADSVPQGWRGRGLRKRLDQVISATQDRADCSIADLTEAVRRCASARSGRFLSLLDGG